MTVVTRFAPSPTGFLHIGGARTALFNWLYAKHHGGKFCLRIEDTDRKRSTDEAVDAILAGLKWLGLDWDGDVVSQFANKERHAAVVGELLAGGHAYKCYCSPEELKEMRETAKAEGRPPGYDGRWRDRPDADAPAGVAPAIRLKAPRDGETIIEDGVQGTVRVGNEQLDDMVLMRADGTPTYMLAVVVDDHDMGVSHVIRGDDHLTNAFRQAQIYKAMGWEMPHVSHIPLIHGPDGAKLSKRHGALGVEAYRDMGYLPEALRNYLLRLGWGHGDDEIISTEQAIEWFDLGGIGKSASRFDFAKLANLNGIYMRRADNAHLAALVMENLPGVLGCDPVPEAELRISAGMDSLKERAKTVLELTENSALYGKSRPLELDKHAAKILSDESRARLGRLRVIVAEVATWTSEPLEQAVRDFAETEAVKLGDVAQPLRAALTGTKTSPPIFEVMVHLGRDETLGRIEDATG